MAFHIKRVVTVYLVLGSVQATLAFYSLVSESFSRFNISHRHLERAVSEAIMGPLRDKWTLVLADEAEELFSVSNVLFDIHESENHPVFISGTQADWLEQLPPPSVLSGQCAVVLIVSKWPSWLIETGDDWSPGVLLVVNVNSSMVTQSLLSVPQIQRAPSLALLEVSEESLTPLVYTSHPFLRDDRGHRLIKDLIGNWIYENFQTRQQLFPARFNSFGGDVLHVASDLDDYPLIFEEDGKLDGTNIRILNVLGNWLNFTYTTTVYAADENWGELVNGSWNGLLGEVYRGEKNLTVNYFTVVFERSRDFDHTSSYFYEGFGFALMIPPPMPAWMSILYPFSLWVWTSVVGLLLLIPPVLYLLTKAATFDSNISAQNAAMEVLRRLLKQDSAAVSQSNVVRLVLASWSIGGFILVSCYTSNLIAVLTVPFFPPKISTIEGLAESDFRISMVDYGEFVPEALATSQDEHLKALGDRMDLINNYEDDDVSYDELVGFLMDGRHAITETYSYLRNLLAHAKRAQGKAYVLKEQIYQGALAFFLAKHTPWKDRLDQGLRRLVEGGLVNKWYTDIMSKMSDTVSIQKSSSKEKPLTLSNLQGPFILLLLGNAVAMIIFFLELLLHGAIYGKVQPVVSPLTEQV